MATLIAISNLDNLDNHHHHLKLHKISNSLVDFTGATAFSTFDSNNLNIEVLLL
jgi:hypothetical protein